MHLCNRLEKKKIFVSPQPSSLVGPIVLPIFVFLFIFSYDSLPPEHWKKYIYGARFVGLVRSKTPKITLYTPTAKCILMENAPNPDFEACYYLDSIAWSAEALRVRMGRHAKITGILVKDIRFPTSLQHDGSDAMHTNPDYSCAYVILETDSEHRGHGLTFTCGNGTEVVVAGIKSMKNLIVGKQAYDIFDNFGAFWRKLTSDSQLRWIGPEKGVMHLATAAVINALWDLWGRLEGKPVWKLLSDMTPEQLVSTIDFRYITDVVTEKEAVGILRKDQALREQREKELLAEGYPAYTTQVGWLGYSDAKIKTLCQQYLDQGFTAFKVKVGQNLENDRQRCSMVRESIGWENTLMVDANQVWGVQEAIDWMVQLKEFKPLWIEEPTSPDDILGHATIAKALEPHGIKVATGEMCANRIMFKQFLQHNALQYCQIDSARIGGVNEILSVYLMARKLNVKVCPHAGGVGLCEMVQHLQFWDYICLNGDKEGKWIEYVDQQHEHFKVPTNVQKAAYIPPLAPGYNTEMFEATLQDNEYPRGKVWQELIKQGKHYDPS